VATNALEARLRREQQRARRLAERQEKRLLGSCRQQAQDYLTGGRNGEVPDAGHLEETTQESVSKHLDAVQQVSERHERGEILPGDSLERVPTEFDLARAYGRTAVKRHLPQEAVYQRECCPWKWPELRQQEAVVDIRAHRRDTPWMRELLASAPSRRRPCNILDPEDVRNSRRAADADVDTCPGPDVLVEGRLLQQKLEREQPDLAPFVPTLFKAATLAQVAQEAGVSRRSGSVLVERLRRWLAAQETFPEWVAYHLSYLAVETTDEERSAEIRVGRATRDGLRIVQSVLAAFGRVNADEGDKRPCNPAPPHLRRGGEGSVHHFSGELSFYLDLWWEVHRGSRRRKKVSGRAKRREKFLAWLAPVKSNPVKVP
jgi:hypothetical protein